MISSDPTSQVGFTLLNELSDSEIAWFRGAGETRECERGAVLVAAGSRIDTLYLVVRGVLSVTIGGPNGREIAKLGPGQVVGEMSFLEDRPASATVRALESSDVVAISRAVIETKLKEDTAFSAHLYRGLAIVTSRRLRNAVGQLERWLETEPVAEPEVIARWSEVARITQDFKKQVVAAGKENPEGLDGADLVEPLGEFAEALERSIGYESPENVDAREELGARVQRELLPYFLKARTSAQLFEMPRGYAGDFRAFEMIHADKPDGSPPVGTMLDRAFLALPVMKAFRCGRPLLQAELRRVAEEYAERALRITAVASAPATELRGLIAAKPDADLTATLIEFDDEALEWARGVHRGPRVRIELESLVNLALGQRQVGEGDQSLASTPLISFFADRFAIGILNYLHSMLAPGGWACVSSVHPRNPNRAFLQHILCWDMAHRDEERVRSLFRRSAFATDNVRFEAEPQGIFYLAICQKT